MREAVVSNLLTLVAQSNMIYIYNIYVKLLFVMQNWQFPHDYDYSNTHFILQLLGGE